MTTARELLAEGLIDKFLHKGHTTVCCPNLDFSPLDRDDEPCWTCRVRAFLAQPEEAREAVLMRALGAAHDALWDIDRGGVESLEDWLIENTGLGEAHRDVVALIDAALADTSPAALLAQGGAMREALKVELWSHVQGAHWNGATQPNACSPCRRLLAALASPTQGKKI